MHNPLKQVKLKAHCHIWCIKTNSFNVISCFLSGENNTFKETQTHITVLHLAAGWLNFCWNLSGQSVQKRGKSWKAGDLGRESDFSCLCSKVSVIPLWLASCAWNHKENFRQQKIQQRQKLAAEKKEEGSKKTKKENWCVSSLFVK